jgi:hypothetical protein
MTNDIKGLKALFLLPGRFAPLAHAIARKLKDDYGVSRFSGLTYTRSSYNFLSSQKDIDYQPLLTDAAIYKLSEDIELDRPLLAQFEEEYGAPNLWPYVLIDRSLFVPSEGHPSYPVAGSRLSIEQLEKLLQAHFSAILGLLDEAKPDFIVGNSPGHMGTLILAHVAKSRGIPTLFFGRTRLLNKVTFSYDPYENFDQIFQSYADLKDDDRKSDFRQEAEDFLHTFRSERLFYEGSRAQRISSELQKMTLARELATLFSQAKNTAHGMYGYFRGIRAEKPYPSGPLDLLRRFFVTAYRRFTLRNWNGFSAPVEGEVYFFYPLHVEPELSLLLLGQSYLDQINVIQQVAKSLPISTKLYVKEHPSMFGLRPKSFYTRLLQIPNIRIIHARVDSHAMIRNARVVVTTTGTAGLEAILLGKPVITLGDAFYSRIDLVHKAESLTELPNLVAKILSNKNHNGTDHDNNRIVDFVTAIFESSIDADYASLWHAPGGFEAIWKHPHVNILARFVAEEMKISPK